MTIFFTSDLHLRHKNILKFEDRPFDTIEEMEEEIISNWNNIVSPEDTVYELGDFCFGGYDKWTEILGQLNGRKVKIKGNHDSSKIINKLYLNGYYEELYMVGHYMKVDGYILNLSHYPLEIGNRPRIFNLHGHLHGVPTKSQYANNIDVGVDSPLNFNRSFGQPISLDEVITYLEYISPKIELEFHKERESR